MCVCGGRGGGEMDMVLSVYYFIKNMCAIWHLLE